MAEAKRKLEVVLEEQELIEVAVAHARRVGIVGDHDAVWAQAVGLDLAGIRHRLKEVTVTVCLEVDASPVLTPGGGGGAR